VRFDLIAVGPAHDRAVIRFHPRLTVIGGMGPVARAEFADLLLGALTGTSEEIGAARWTDVTGSGITAVPQADGWYWKTDEGAASASPLALLSLDDDTLRRLVILSAEDFGVVRKAPVDGESPELADARATLAALDADLSEAVTHRARVDALRSEITRIDQGLRVADTDGAQRRQARRRTELERVRVEASAVRGGTIVAEADRRFVASAPEVRASARAWRATLNTARAEQRRFGNRERLDARTLSEGLRMPEHVPSGLDALAAAYELAEAETAELDARLNALASGALPQPSHPAVVRLAHSDQDLVWSVARRATEAAARLESQSLALGGLQAEGVAPAAAAQLEAAHDAVDLAERDIDRRRLRGLGGALVGLLVTMAGIISSPLVAVLGLAIIAGSAAWAIAVPRRNLARRRLEEETALQSAGVASYMAFQMRRLEVTIDPKATEPLELAALEYRRALAAWRKIAGELAAADALSLEDETRAYARSLSGSQGAANEIADVRRQLAADAEPALAKARAALIGACEPFGIDDPRLAVELVRAQAGTSSLARLQAVVEQAEADERQARRELERRLAELGFGGMPTPGAGYVPADDAEIERRVDAYNQAVTEAASREQARADGRPVADVEADLARLETAADGDGGEWDDHPVGRSEESPDVEGLRARREEVVSAYEEASRALPDIERLTDRREALERRVAVLISGDADLSAPLETADLEQVLLGRLAAARRVGPHGESVTMILDEPFERIRGERKNNMLDAVERLSSSVQVIYLTDDVDVLVWARRRGPGGALSLLEPAREAEATV